MAVLVTGGMGYIGSHTSIELLNVGKEVIIIDNLCNSNAIVKEKIEEITSVRVGIVSTSPERDDTIIRG